MIEDATKNHTNKVYSTHVVYSLQTRTFSITTMLKHIFPIVLIGEGEEREKQQLAAAEETEKQHKALLLMRLCGMIRERSYLTSQALIPSATSPWNQLDKEGTDKNFLNILGLT